MTRKRLLRNILTISTAATVVQIPPNYPYASSVSHADVTNKIASQPALRYIKRSIKELESLEFYAAENDYKEIILGLRNPAIKEIRKNALILIRGGEDGPERENLVESYSLFVKEFEILNSEASSGY